MADFTKVDGFITDLEAIESLTALQDCFTAAITPLGFDKHSCLPAVDLNHPPDNALLLLAFPEDWVTHYKERQYFKEDIVLKTIFHTNRPCLWKDLKHLDPCNQRIFAEAREFGIRNGLTIPVMLPGHYPTSVTIAGEHRDISPTTYHALHLMAVYYHHAMIRICGAAIRLPELSDKQVQCLLWAARGKADADIGEILEITPRTVNHHIEQLRRRLQVRTRAQAIVLATSCGLITP
mgnify:CR=1 FL=1|tara:strand:- start:121 stop:828 length:708 start_codon:yes stop_codon:yes gene_type:complete